MSKPTARSAFRPVSDIYRDLIRDLTPKELRLPKPKREPKRMASAVELLGVTVLSVTPTTDGYAATVTITRSDQIRLDVGARTFMLEGSKTKRKAEGGVTLSFGEGDVGPTLIVRLANIPAGLVPGALISTMRVSFGHETSGESATIIAIADNVVVAEAEVTIAPITLGEVYLGPLIPVEGVDEDPIAQAKAERWLVAALAYQDKQRARRR